MAAFFRLVGFLFLAVAVWLLLAGIAGWAEEGTLDALATRAGFAGAAALAAGIMIGILGRVTRPLQRSHCARCGARTERGQFYCLDHLRATVNEARDESRDAIYQRGSRPAR